jgi:hypothetical protein
VGASPADERAGDCRTVVTVDSPSAGAVVSTEVLVRGWALDANQPDGSGVQQVHLYLDGEAGQGRLLGAAALGQFRPDVDVSFSSPSSQAGWTYAWPLTSVSPGPHRLHVYAQDACGWQVTVHPVTVSPALITVDRLDPTGSAADRLDLTLVGWAMDPRVATGSGLDALHVYLDGEAGRAPLVGAATLGQPRPDVASALGRPSASQSGYRFTSRLEALPGPHTLFVYAHTSGGEWSYRTVPFELAEPARSYPPLPSGRLFPPGASGFDISWPQCNGPLPPGPYQVAIVGATGGRAFYQNPCLARQFAWARAATATPGLYLNLNGPFGRAAERGARGPAGDCSAADVSCRSANFGYQAAAHAIAYARSQGVSAPVWWLDVETTNSWWEDPALNARVIQGAIDGLRAQGRMVGIYSTPSQWREIAGDFRPGLPVWVAGASGPIQVPLFCTPARGFGGGAPALVQFLRGEFDENTAC